MFKLLAYALTMNAIGLWRVFGLYIYFLTAFPGIYEFVLILFFIIDVYEYYCSMLQC